jgi:hypothetical protein
MSIYLEIKARSFADCMDGSGRVYVFGDPTLDLRLMKRSEAVKEIDLGIPGFHAYELTDIGHELANRLELPADRANFFEMIRAHCRENGKIQYRHAPSYVTEFVRTGLLVKTGNHDYELTDFGKRARVVEL